MDILRRHWPTLAVLLVLGTLYADARCADVPRLEAAVKDALRDAAEDSAAADRWREVARGAEARARLAAQATQEAEARADSLAAMTPEMVTRWRELPDTASVATVRATADSTIAHLTDVAAHWREAFMARGRELSAIREQLVATERERDAHARRAEALQRAVDGLEAQLHSPSPWWSTGVLVAGGAGIGALTGGSREALLGAGVGAATAVVWHGLDDLVGL